MGNCILHKGALPPCPPFVAQIFGIDITCVQQRLRDADELSQPQTGKVFGYWEQHYRQVGRPVPQGEPGSHPSLLTLSEAIEVVHCYGDLA